jgi:hypothetical protein
VESYPCFLRAQIIWLLFFLRELHKACAWRVFGLCQVRRGRRDDQCGAPCVARRRSQYLRLCGGVAAFREVVILAARARRGFEAGGELRERTNEALHRALEWTGVRLRKKNRITPDPQAVSRCSCGATLTLAYFVWIIG